MLLFQLSNFFFLPTISLSSSRSLYSHARIHHRFVCLRTLLSPARRNTTKFRTISVFVYGYTGVSFFSIFFYFLLKHTKWPAAKSLLWFGVSFLSLSPPPSMSDNSTQSEVELIGKMYTDSGSSRLLVRASCVLYPEVHATRLRNALYSGTLSEPIIIHSLHSNFKNWITTAISIWRRSRQKGSRTRYYTYNV